MANLFKLESGKYNALMGKLAEAGLTAEMAEAMLERNDLALAKVAVNAITTHPFFSLVHGLFTKPEDQIKKVREWRLERSWSIPDAALIEAERSIPKWPDNRLTALVLVPYIEDVWSTFFGL